MRFVCHSEARSAEESAPSFARKSRSFAALRMTEGMTEMPQSYDRTLDSRLTTLDCSDE